jgi:hypothetical protein
MESATPHAAPPVAGIYRHYRGQRYRVLGVARHSETEEPFVVYQALYGERGMWLRPLSMFNESVEVHGQRVARFALELAEPTPLWPDVAKPETRPA